MFAQGDSLSMAIGDISETACIRTWVNNSYNKIDQNNTLKYFKIVFRR